MPEVVINTDDLLPVAQVAKLLGRPRITIYRWIEGNKLHAVRFGGILFIPRSEVERLAGEQMNKV